MTSGEAVVAARIHIPWRNPGAAFFSGDKARISGFLYVTQELVMRRTIVRRIKILQIFMLGENCLQWMRSFA
jgi:hypothetical protein